MVSGVFDIDICQQSDVAFSRRLRMEKMNIADSRQSTMRTHAITSMRGCRRKRHEIRCCQKPS